MKYEVTVTDGAMADLADIDDYLSSRESIDTANYGLDALEKTVRSLANLPDRGHYPKELAESGIQNYREIV